MDFHPVGNAGGGQKSGGGAVDEIAAIHGEAGIVAGEFNAGGGAVQDEFIAQPDGLHDGFQFMKSVGAAAEDVQDEVDLAGG
jgi:hypothetical protein